MNSDSWDRSLGGLFQGSALCMITFVIRVWGSLFVLLLKVFLTSTLLRLLISPSAPQLTLTCSLKGSPPLYPMPHPLSMPKPPPSPCLAIHHMPIGILHTCLQKKSCFPPDFLMIFDIFFYVFVLKFPPKGLHSLFVFFHICFFL